MGRVDGKVCIVTGAAMGLGKADAERLVGEGARVVLTDIDEHAGSKVAESLGDRSFFVRHDVRDEDQWREVIRLTMSRFGRLDVLVNNAGIAEFADIESFTVEGWRRVYDVSVMGTVLGCKHAVGAMHRSAGNASIINMSSTAALSGMGMIPAYSAAKGALRGLTRHVAAYCAERGYSIRCNALHPTSMDTPMVAAAVVALKDFVPAGQRANGTKPGSPMEVANAVLYLASDESLLMNGGAIVIDRATTIMEGMAP
jgi:3(or 17)beta-hydroxysteroid dehydrogenase